MSLRREEIHDLMLIPDDHELTEKELKEQAEQEQSRLTEASYSRWLKDNNIRSEALDKIEAQIEIRKKERLTMIREYYTDGIKVYSISKSGKHELVQISKSIHDANNKEIKLNKALGLY